MEDSQLESRLSRISTVWPLLLDAHGAPTEQAQAARLELIQRYQGAAYRYLVGALRDLEAADDLFQELALRFVQGAFRNANPEKGRFRDFLRTTLINLISDHRRRRTRMTPQTRDSMEKQIAGAASIPEADRQFIESWRDEILAQSWEALANIDKSRGTNHYVVLRVRVDNPKTTSAVMVQKVNELLQGRKTYGADGFRKALQRARELFANILVDEVAHSLENPAINEVEQELVDLGLLVYCQDVVAQRRGIK